MLKPMDSRQLHYFRSVVDHGSFTHAAEALNMTQPSLSLSIRKLEKELDVDLLSRGRAGVKTTEAGDYLYKVAAKMATLLAEADTQIRDIAHGRSGSITLCSAPEFNWDLMPEILQRMSEQTPDVRIFLEDPNPTSTLARVLDGSIDIGLIPSTDPTAFAHRYQDDLHVHVAATLPLIIGLPNRLRHLSDPVSLEDLNDETWILPPRNPQFIGLPELLDRVWAKNPGAIPTQFQEIATLQTALPLVSGGVGVSLLPTSARNFTTENINYREIEGNIPPMHAVLIYRKDKELSPAANLLVDTILEVGSEQMFAQANGLKVS